MEQSNNEQNSVIFSIAEIIGKMSNQVNFLIRNHKLLSQLDVDMLMENTRRLYDKICSVQCNMDVDSIPMEVEGMRNEEIRVEDLDTDSDTDLDEIDDDVNDDVNDEIKMDFEIEIDAKEEFEEDIEEEFEEEDTEENIEEDIEEYLEEESEEESEEEEIENESEEETEKEPEEDSGIRSYIKTSPQAYTIGDKLEKEEDNSLASVLQKKAVTDLMTAIDLNDRFMFLNELFNSNMEKYNKAIRTLNNFSTLLGAKTYMSELQIELQWDCESDAYKRLADLIERRYI